MRREYALACIYVFFYTVLFTVWCCTIYFEVKNAETLVGFIRDALVGLTAHIFTLIDPTRKPSLP